MITFESLNKIDDPELYKIFLLLLSVEFKVEDRFRANELFFDFFNLYPPSIDGYLNYLFFLINTHFPCSLKFFLMILTLKIKKNRIKDAKLQTKQRKKKISAITQ